MNLSFSAKLACVMRAEWHGVRLARIARQTIADAQLATARDLPFRQIFASRKIQERWRESKKDVLATIGGTHFSGAVNDGDQRALFYLVHHCRPRTVLEIGTRFGASAVYLAYALKQLWGKDGRLTTIDIQNVNDRSNGIYRSGGPRHTPLEHMAKLDCLDVVEFVTAPSHDFLAKTDTGFDFIFIDGSHRAELVYLDIIGALRRINPGGFILLHDFYPGGRPLWRTAAALPGPYLAVERLLRECTALNVVPLDTLPWRTRPGSRTTSLAALVAAAHVVGAGHLPGVWASAAAEAPGLAPV